jgi:hypothetical protein
MTCATSDDPKKPAPCPGGGGHPADFTSLVKCVRCGKVRCGQCVKRFRQRPYCKSCMKEEQREDSRKDKR